MKILAIDFSSNRRSVAALNDSLEGETVETNPRATDALGLIDSALREAKLEREQVGLIVVGLGPGSYTGVRASIALAQGWQLAGNVKLLGISSVRAIAIQAQTSGMRGSVTVVIDAQRGEFYSATYEISDCDARETAALKIVSAEEIRAKEIAGEMLIGPEVTRWFPDGKIISPSAKILARLGSETAEGFVSGEKLEPIYLRETTFVKAPPARVIS